MATLASPPFSGGRPPPPAPRPLLSSSSSCYFSERRTFGRRSILPSGRSPAVVASAVPVSNAQTRERERLKELFREARKRCLADPMDGVSFTLEDFLAALGHYQVDSQVGARVKGVVLSTNENGALIEIGSKSPAYLPVNEASLYKVRHVAEAGICPGLEEEFIVVGQNSASNMLILSLRSIQCHLAWKRCVQLQSEDSTVISRVVGCNKGGMIAIVEGLQGLIPFPQILMKSSPEELIGQKLLVKLVEVEEEQSRLVLSNRKALEVDKHQIQIGAVVSGTVKSLKQYGAIIDIGGVTGLLHVSQISRELVVDVAHVLKPGEVLKVMILNYDWEKGHLSFSTKKLEPQPGDMIRNPKLVFEKAEKMAQLFRQRVAKAGEKICYEVQKFQPKSDSIIDADVISGPLTSAASGLGHGDSSIQVSNVESHNEVDVGGAKWWGEEENY